MKNRKLIIALSFAVLIVLMIVGVYTVNHIPDYVWTKEILKGYKDTDGRSYAGKDLDEYFYYTYNDGDAEKFAESGLYTEVTDENIEEVIKAALAYERWNDDIRISSDVSVGDYYILKCFNSDGNEVEWNEDNLKFYFYDTEKNTLHYAYSVN